MLSKAASLSPALMLVPKLLESVELAAPPMSVLVLRLVPKLMESVKFVKCFHIVLILLLLPKLESVKVARLLMTAFVLWLVLKQF